MMASLLRFYRVAAGAASAVERGAVPGVDGTYGLSPAASSSDICVLRGGHHLGARSLSLGGAMMASFLRFYRVAAGAASAMERGAVPGADGTYGLSPTASSCVICM